MTAPKPFLPRPEACLYKYDSAKFQPNPLFYSQQMASESAAEEQKEQQQKKVGKPIGDPVLGRDAPTRTRRSRTMRFPGMV